MMASTSGSIGSSRKFLIRDLKQEVSSSSGLGDLPSKRLLGKGLNSIGYETEVKGKRFARQDFVGVPSSIFKEEASVLVEIEAHKNVVKTIGWTVDNRSCSLVSEYMEDTLLVFLLKRKQRDKDHPSSQAQLFELQLDTMWQIASGMEYLHAHGFSHGDLKTRNILVSPSYYGRPMIVKVADYGRVRTKRKSMAFACRQARMRDVVRWKAPELLGRMSTWDGDETSSESDLETSEGENSSSSNLWGRNRGEVLSEIHWREGLSAASSSNIYYRECSADVYSFAVTCSQILSNGEDPYPDVGKWKDLKELRDQIVAHDVRPELPGTCRPELATLLKSCWGTVPSLRPQFWYIRRALEGMLPHRQGPILAAPHVDHLKQYTPAARVFIVAHLIYKLTCFPYALDEPMKSASGDIQRALSEEPEVIRVIRPYVVEIKVKLSVLWRKMFQLEQIGWMELNALKEVAEVMKELLSLASENLRTSPPWLQELSNEIDEIDEIPSAEGQKWYHLLQNMLSRRPRSREDSVRMQEDFLEVFNLVTQLGEVLFVFASLSSKEFLELLEERGRDIAIVMLEVPNLDGDGLRRMTDLLRGECLFATFDESMKVLRVTGFHFDYDDLKLYVRKLVSRVTSSLSMLSKRPEEKKASRIRMRWIEEVTSGPETIYVGKEALNRARVVSEAPSVEWVIGLDFGTTYSGFGYAKLGSGQNPDVFLYYHYPKRRPEKVYCKTFTGLYYGKSKEGGENLECSSWGYNARSDYLDSRDKQRVKGNVYLTKFKLLLTRDLNDPDLADRIPPPLTPMSIITDYLRLIGEHALTQVRNHHVGVEDFGPHLVQWVVTVPSIWDENAKQNMKTCMVNAGLVSDMDAVLVVLEPEAASFHCHQILRKEQKDVSLNRADKILVADVGGGTVDIVVQEMVGNSETYQVQELTESSGGLCGGTFVDESFMRVALERIPYLEEYMKEHPSFKTRLLSEWEEIKCSFDHDMWEDDTRELPLPNRVAERREAYERERGNTLEDPSKLELTQQDLKAIFDPVVDDILSLIGDQLQQVPDIKVMFVVGGFADSPYLMRRIRTRFEGEVQHIVSPANPGAAIVQGAVLLAFHPEAIVSRIAKKTYGTSVILPFEAGIDPPHLKKITNGVEYCRSRFDVFVRKGDRVEVDKCVTKDYVPHGDEQKAMVSVWSSPEQDPRHAESPSATKEGDFAISLPENYNNVHGKQPKFDLSMFFGRSSIELAASTAGGLVLPVRYCS